MPVVKKDDLPSETAASWMGCGQDLAVFYAVTVQVKARLLLVPAQPSQTQCVAARPDTTWPQRVIARNMCQLNHWIQLSLLWSVWSV